MYFKYILVYLFFTEQSLALATCWPKNDLMTEQRYYLNN